MKQLTPYKLRGHTAVFIQAHMLMRLPDLRLFFAVVRHICKVLGLNPGPQKYSDCGK